MRQPLRNKRPGRQMISEGASMPAPVGGWDAVSPLANMKPDRAVRLDNWNPRPGYIEIRRGHTSHSVLVGATDPVESLMAYHGTTSDKLFAAAGDTIYDASTSAGEATTETGLSNARFQYVNFTTSGGKFLWACNGTDAPIHYNGTSWAEPSLTVNTFGANDIVHVNAHKNRLWFVFRNSTVAGYLATGAVAGSVTNFELGGLFTKGGYLVAMGTWTRDGGDGEDDLAVFISSRGQCAIYQGTDPAAASTWALVGVFDLGAPLGRRCFTKVAGDLALVNIDGVLPLSRAIGQDRGAAAAIAITKNINNAMNEAAREYASNFGWELTAYPKGTLAILNVPLQETTTQHQYVMNTLTGAWCRWTGQNANCWAVYQDNLYFGGNEGVVYRADYGALDFDTEIDAQGQTAYSYFKSPGVVKHFKMVQTLLTTDSDSRPAVGISTDFKDNATVGTPTSAGTVSAKFDSATWDLDVFPVESRNVSDWSTLNGIGSAGSIHFRARTGDIDSISLWGEAIWGSSVWSNIAEDGVVVQLNGFNVITERGSIF